MVTFKRIIKSTLCIVLELSTASLIDLSQNEFRKLIKSEPIALVLFYAPWCSVSRDFIPIFDEAFSDEVSLAKVNCVQEEALYTEHSIQSFPTLIAFVYGKRITYDKTYDKDGLDAFLSRIVNSGSRSIKDNASLKYLISEYLSPTRPIAIATGNDPYMLIAYEYACIKTNSITCGHTDNIDISAVYGLTSPGIFLYRSFEKEEDIIIAPQSILKDSSQIVRWIYQYSSPQLLKLTPENENLIFDSTRPGYSIHFVLVGSTSDVRVESSLSNLRRLYSKFWDRCKFIFLDSSDSSAYISDVLEDIQVRRGSAATLVGIKTMKTKVDFYHCGECIDSHVMEAWMHTVIGGTIDANRSTVTG